MSLFTFIFPYKGGTYIKQVEAETISDAITAWVALAKKDRYGNDKEKLPDLDEELKNEKPVALKGLTNAWTICLFSGRAFTILNIVKTVENNSQSSL